MGQNTPDIQIPNIDKELEHLWRDSGGNKQRACLFTLIIYARSLRYAQYLQELVDTILDKFPCRIIFIQNDVHMSSSYLHVEVSNVSTKKANGELDSGIACDKISITASQDQLYRVPYIVIPQIVSDLPVYLLWGQNPFEERDLFPSLQPYASRVVFDSECSEDLGKFCKEMERNLDDLNMEVMDINWALVSNWRDLLTEIFHTDKKIEELADCTEITLTYNNSPSETQKHPEIRAIYLQGWLAARLGWKYIRTQNQNNIMILHYTNRKGNGLKVTLQSACNESLPPGMILSIDISGKNQFYHIQRQPSISQAIIHASTQDKCELPYSMPLPNIHVGLHFMREIFYRQLGTHYRETIEKILPINPNTNQATP